MAYLAHLRSDFDRRFRGCRRIVQSERGSERPAGGQLAHDGAGPRAEFHLLTSVSRVRMA